MVLSSAPPSPDPTGIHMDEVGFSVIPHTPAPQTKRSPIELTGIDTRQPDVNGLALHVETVFGYTMTMLTQHGIGLG